ncbi:alpha-amylase [Aspergillus sclerotioniger CBS 115572]|uniref:alpha-amylase n=1 Tax=Aspergillus sclerotioniger CBS 115572 TaxID=1450535 RepID=A0A317X4M6_9EURO|nr:alpha-amylase [Aspergillus sclerotioniger CBS 115572]PWY91510.1 alpha-amylase [Aspergillus sclerotioniger CBS 115572]
MGSISSLRTLVMAGLLGTSLAATTEQWKSRTIYQTMTDRFARTDGSTTSPCNTTEGVYCGGTWKGTIDKLDYIQGMGFDAIMISPVIENLEGRVSYGEAYHGYWPLDLYSLNSHFGTHQDLLDLSKALHDRGMYLMMDTVLNNMAYMTNGSDPATHIDYSALTPFNSSSYYHPYCKITDWNNYTNAQLCQTGDNIVALPDLYTEHSEVQEMLENWAKEIMSTYSIDGLRIDAAKHVTPSFLKNFGDAVNTFMTGEVMQQEVSTICEYQNNYIGSLPNYPIYYALLNAFTLGNTTALATQVQAMKSACSDVTALASFSENHDVARFASMTKDMALAKNVLTFTLLFDGVPIVYQGQEHHLDGGYSPVNREAIWLTEYKTDAELYKLISKLNAIRKHAARLDPQYVNMQTYTVFEGGSELGFRKGVDGRQVIMLLSTQGTEGGPYNLSMPVSFTGGTVATEVLNCVNYTVNELSELVVPMDKGEPRVFFPAELMPGSGLCGFPVSNVSYATLKTKAASTKAAAAASLGVKTMGNIAYSALFSLGLSVVASVVVGVL